MKHISSLIVLLSVLSISSAEERGATLLLAGRPPVLSATPTPAPTPPPSLTTNRPSAVEKDRATLTYSVHSRGFVGNYEVVTLRERGLWGNGSLTTVLVDRHGEIVAILNSSASAGPGIAMVQGASFVGGMYLFAEHMRPDQQKINSGNTGGGTSISNSSSNNNDNNAQASGSAQATAGTGDVTSGTFTPPGQINNPGHRTHNPHNP